MKKLTIGIDIDDTITDTFYHLMPAVAEYFNVDIDYLKKNKISYTTLTKEMKEKELDFAKENFSKYIPSTPIKKDAVEYIKKIKKLGHNILIITARNDIFYENARKISEDYLKKHNIEYDELFCTIDKVGICKEQKVDIFIDDSVNQCNRIKNAGIKTLLFVSPINENNEEHDKVYTWQDVYYYIANHS